MPSNKPLIYIAAVRRSGSTLLASLLSQLPKTLVFPEPHFASGGYRIDRRFIDALSAHGLDLLKIKRAWHKGDKTGAFAYFKETTWPLLQSAGMQVGIKEIVNRGWAKYVDLGVPIKFILLGRDPRDIYISLEARLKAEPAKLARAWPGGFHTQALAAYLEQQAAIQSEIASTQETMQVRYEDLCTEAALIEDVRHFAESEIETPETALFFEQPHRPKGHSRQPEHRPAGQVSSDRVARWRRQDQSRQQMLAQLLELCPKYQKLWRYE